MRSLRRTGAALQQLRDAAVGAASEAADAALRRIMRGVVHAESLYAVAEEEEEPLGERKTI